MDKSNAKLRRGKNRFIHQRINSAITSLMGPVRKKRDNIDISPWLRCEDGSSALTEVAALFKASVLIILAAGALAAMANLPAGPSRVVAATVISNTPSKFSQTSHHAVAQLQNGDKVQIRLSNKTSLAPGQLIEINQHSSMFTDIPSYSYPAKTAD